jgi:hypothetical protein
MELMISFDKPTVCIVHTVQDEQRAAATLTRMPVYQCLIDCQEKNISPSGEYFRFNHDVDCELHGWFKLDDIRIDEVLQEGEAEETDGKWKVLEFKRAA